MNLARDRGASVIETTLEAEDAWVAEMQRAAKLGLKFYSECTPGYYNNEGKPFEEPGKSSGTFFGRAQNGPYGGGPIAFVKILEDWRAEGSLSGMELR
jgi:cyclohexanone monooxygenase